MKKDIKNFEALCKKRQVTKLKLSEKEISAIKGGAGFVDVNGKKVWVTDDGFFLDWQ